MGEGLGVLATLDGESGKKIVLITGASSGFGRSTAALMAKKGYVVFGTSRKPKSENDEGFSMLQLDVDSDDSAESCVSSVIDKAGRVDVLVNNAGYVLTGGIEETSIAEAKAQFETNFFGTVRMTKAVLPGMRLRRSGRIVNVGSLSGTFPVPFEGFYASTKAALVAFSEALRGELMQFGIKVSLVEPGFFHTNLSNARKVAANPIGDYSSVRERAISRLLKDIDGGGDATAVAETIIEAIESPSPKLRYPVGREKRYLLAKRILPSSILESQVRKHWGIE